MRTVLDLGLKPRFGEEDPAEGVNSDIEAVGHTSGDPELLGLLVTVGGLDLNRIDSNGMSLLDHIRQDWAVDTAPMIAMGARPGRPVVRPNPIVDPDLN